jgi:hypothetical protein
MSTICEAASHLRGDALDGARHREAEGAHGDGDRVAGGEAVRFFRGHGGTHHEVAGADQAHDRTGIPGPNRAPPFAKRSAIAAIQVGACCVLLSFRDTIPM